MLEYKRYQILNLNFINELDTVILDSKFKYISDFIFRPHIQLESAKCVPLAYERDLIGLKIDALLNSY